MNLERHVADADSLRAELRLVRGALEARDGAALRKPATTDQLTAELAAAKEVRPYE